MNLVIDIGNTSTKTAVFDETGNLREVFTEAGRSVKSLPGIFSKYPVKSGIIASVVDVPPEMVQEISSYAVPMLWLDGKTALPVANLYETPETLGPDRIAAVVGAWSEFPQKNILVIDAGTAITYDFIDAEGQYRGGNISPGIQMRFDALHGFTGRLPLVNRQGELLELGKSTETAIRAGVLGGVDFEVSGYITSLRDKYPGLLVFLTGGDDFSFATKLKNIIFADRFLVLKGLNRILEFHNDKQ